MNITVKDINEAAEGELVALVAVAVNALVARELRALSGEHWTPRFAADQSDTELTFRRQRIDRLRILRDEFESIMHGLEKSE